LIDRILILRARKLDGAVGQRLRWIERQSRVAGSGQAVSGGQKLAVLSDPTGAADRVDPGHPRLRRGDTVIRTTDALGQRSVPFTDNNL